MYAFRMVAFFAPFLFAIALGSRIVGFKQFAARPTRPTDYLAVLHSSSTPDLARGVTDVSLMGIATAAQLCVSAIDWGRNSNYRALSCLTYGSSLFSCTMRGVK